VDDVLKELKKEILIESVSDENLPQITRTLYE